ncbi:diguanylate cyclase, partial [Candidatus Magnetomorum sp. HK-1]
MFRFIILSLVFFYSLCISGMPSLWAEEAPSLSINSEVKQLNLSNYLSWFKDIDHELNIEDIINPERNISFVHAQGKTLNFGFSSDTFWLKLSFTAENLIRPALRYIHIRYPLLNQIDCYVFNNKEMQHIKCGTKYPFSNRPLKHPEFIFPIQILPDENITVYFQVRSSSSIQFPMILWEPTEFYSNEIVLFMGTAGLYTFFIVISLLNLIFYWM